MSAPLSHTRIPKAARDLCQSRAEMACVYWLWDQADEARGEPFRMATRDFREGLLSSGAATRLLKALTEAGLLVVLEKGRGTTPSLVAVRDATTGLLRSEEAPAERKASATRAQGERKASAEDADEDSVSDGAENATRAQGERKASANGALNARAGNSLQPPTSNLQEQEEQQQPAQQPLPEPEPTAADASESGKPDDPIRALWDKWEPKRVEVYGGRVGKLTKARRSAMRARIKDHSAEEVGLVLAWWLTSSHERATFLRANGCTWDTVLRPTKFPAYLEMAGQAAESRRQRALPTGSDQTERAALEAIAKMRALYADHGSLPYDKMPPAIVGALREIGGIRYLFGAVNDFQQRDRTNAFVAAYRRHAAGTENG